jgi:hypothetical protein
MTSFVAFFVNELYEVGKLSKGRAYVYVLYIIVWRTQDSSVVMTKMVKRLVARVCTAFYCVAVMNRMNGLSMMLLLFLNREPNNDNSVALSRPFVLVLENFRPCFCGFPDTNESSN